MKHNDNQTSNKCSNQFNNYCNMNSNKKPVHQNKMVLNEDMQPLFKIKKQNDHEMTHHKELREPNKFDIDLKNNSAHKNFKLNRKFYTFNSGSTLNSLADYNLSNLGDEMFNLKIDYKKHDIKNNSLDSLNHIRARVNKKTENDEFAAYRLMEDHDSTIPIENVDVAKNDNEINETKVKTVKKNRHHHHRAKRHRKPKETEHVNQVIKKSQSSLSFQTACVKNETNQDSLSAFDFSNTDDFWEDDIVINSELIESDKFMQENAESNSIKFVSLSCECLNLEADKIDLSNDDLVKEKTHKTFPNLITYY